MGIRLSRPRSGRRCRVWTAPQSADRFRSSAT